MATYDLTQTTPAKLQTGDIINVPYSGTYKTITLPKGIYKLEVWGAQGGSFNTTYVGGKGGYSYGTLTLTDKETILYCYAGGKGTDGTTSGTFAGGWNGGGQAYTSSATYDMSAGGGGSDIRIGSTSLYARVIVAGGGGGAGSYSGSYRYSGGAGGGESGVAGSQYSTSYKAGLAGSQTAAGTSYYGTTANSTSYGTVASFGTGASGSSGQIAGGGGGWYGGGYARRASGGGGSGYVYTSSTASNYPSGCLLTSAYYLTDAATVSGNTSFVDYSGSTVTGHSGNGYVRITVVEIKNSLKVKTSDGWKDGQECYVKTNDNTWKVAQSVYVKVTENLTVLDYIESTGTQYIDTGFVPNQNTRVVCNLDVTPNSGETIPFGSATDGSKNYYYPDYTGGQWYYCYGTQIASTGVVTVNGLTIELNKNIITVNDTSATVTEQTFIGQYPISLFAVNIGGTVGYYTTMKLYSCTIYDNDVLIRDYIPVLDKDGVACLYDKVTNKLYYNSGTGSFIAGYKYEYEPETELVFLESDGASYIDTGFKPNQDTRVVIDYEILDTNTAEAHISSARTSGSTPLWTLYSTSALKLVTRYGTGAIQTLTSPTGAGRYLFDKNKNILSIDGIQVNEVAYETFSVTSTLTIFARNDGTAVNAYNKGRLYSYKLYDNDTLIRDYIPKADAQGTPALFDKVSGTYYYNQGTGTFGAGQKMQYTYWKQII